MTEEETILWSKLRNKQLLGYKFRRQHGIGKYVVDFCCVNKKLIIELDGDQHGYEENQKYDLLRTEYLERLGFNILRFTNWQVRKELKMIVDTIFVNLDERPPLSSPPW
jgi:very-short-patch-repair endonuclease